MLKAIIFDMDGLMFDTERLSEKAWKFAGDKFGYDIKPEHVAKIRGIDVDHSKVVFEEIFGDEFDFFEIRELKVQFINEYVDENEVPVKAGLIELLDYVKERGLKIGLATSTENKTAIYFLSKADVLSYFDKIISGDMVIKGKPHPEIFIMAMEKLEVDPSECIILEDSPNGIRAANEAGCRVIMVPDIDEPTQELEEICFDIANSLNEIIQKLKDIE